MKKILYIISAIAFVASVSSCRSFLDINTDPNTPASENITTSMILPGVEAALATSYGDFYRITGGYYSQQYAHLFGTSNYIDYSQFQMSATRSSTHYTQLYQKVLVNCKDIKAKASAAEDWNTYLAAVAYTAFAYQILVDCYGETPYSQALDDVNYLTPKYDEGVDVYKGIVAELDAALQKATPGKKVATNLLFPNGDSTDWIAFAKSVEFKILMRMSGAVDVKEKLKTLVSDNLITSDAEFAGCWSNAQYNANPYYSEEFAPWHSQSNVCANVAVIRTMIEYDADGKVVYRDPRLATYFDKNSSGEYIGGISGTNFAATAPAPYNNAAGFCRPIVNYDTPVSLISVAEIEFFKSEYYARFGSEGEAADHYAKAIEASFASAGVEGAAEYIAKYPFSKAKYAECIGKAKWVALAGSNNFEAWCEARRLGYPAFGSVSGSDMWDGASKVNVSIYEPGTLYTPYLVFAQVGEKKLLARWPYANASQSRNSSTPEFKGYSKPVFWAK